MTSNQKLAVVTGAAGFIGSHLCEGLLKEGYKVRAIDCFTPYYGRDYKDSNLAPLVGQKHFEFHESDLRTADLFPLLQGADVLYHLAAQPGVRASWGEDFVVYAGHNITATHRLLEAARGSELRRVVYASSSSVYGEAVSAQTKETDLPRPISPYGVSKLAGENLMSVYASQFGLETVSLRYFTVCGPRQRPDMAFTKMLKAAFEGETFPVYGSGEQERDFTFVGDVVAANVAAAERGESGAVYNIGGGNPVTLNQTIQFVEQHTREKVRVKNLEAAEGDPKRTAADISLARDVLGYAPKVSVQDAIGEQVAWFKGKQGPLSRSKGPVL